MGQLINGVWHDQWYDTSATQGRFQRQDAPLRSWVTADGSPGPTGRGGFKAEPGRYHLYIARACPWAHRAMIFRALKGLEGLISVSIVHPHMGEHGWTFEPDSDVIPDTINGARYLYEVYLRSEPGFTGRVTVPLLWDRQTGRIVSNESADIIRMFNSAFDAVGAAPGDYYPAEMRAEIDAVNERVYATVNNGVYRAGFATTQAAYEEAVGPLFDSLSWLETLVSQRHFVAGGRLTEADWRLFTTLLRFDAVYHGHFKCNVRRLVDYPALWSHTRELFQMPGVRETVNFDHIKRHYYGSHRTINPTGIVPVGPALDFEAPPGR
ncbi:MAG: glutathione S-transferase family protein [Myxococcales bacterium]|nr:MAG: glutathione S-transferase family protein [Myxococcales bacterium]